MIMIGPRLLMRRVKLMVLISFGSGINNLNYSELMAAIFSVK